MKYTTPAGETPRLFLSMLQQPHLLIAGSTGSGKSVAINGLITTALYKAPGEVNLILVDPKRVELAAYKNLPHTIAHAAGYNPEAWKDALQKAVATMDSRYEQLEKAGLKEYLGGDLYVVIDEYAAVAKGDLRGQPCKKAILRLTSEGRAAHVHVILATQVPKATILPTEIRDNFTAKLALMCDTKQQSRVIMDRAGCEVFPSPRVAGKALGYYTLPGNDVTLWEIPYTPESETQRIIDHWTKQAKHKIRFPWRRTA